MKMGNIDAICALSFGLMNLKVGKWRIMMGEGRKDDTGKLRMDLVPVPAIRAMARGFGYGADKYEAWNWTKGLSTGRLYGALLRHLTAWWDGEDFDPESGLHHLDHVLCCAAMLQGTVEHKLAQDDRPRAHPRFSKEQIN